MAQAGYPEATITYHEGDRSHRVQKTDISSGVATAVTVSRLVLPGGDVGILMGWSLTETSGVAVAQLRLHDGLTAATEQFCRVNLAAGESNRDTIGKMGVVCSTGRVFLSIITGSVEGVLYWIPADWT
jgi:hypothetical protein